MNELKTYEKNVIDNLEEHKKYFNRIKAEEIKKTEDYETELQARIDEIKLNDKENENYEKIIRFSIIYLENEINEHKKMIEQENKFMFKYDQDILYLTEKKIGRKLILEKNVQENKKIFSDLNRRYKNLEISFKSLSAQIDAKRKKIQN